MPSRAARYIPHHSASSCTDVQQRAHFLELGVIRTFDFVSALRRMTVITKRLKSKSMEIYLKGAPEILKDVCDPESCKFSALKSRREVLYSFQVPEDYEDLLSYYTKNGYRVIGIAGKSVEGLSWLKAQRMKREQVESGLQFLGLIIFENKLKPGTAPAIAALREAYLGCRMVTGDNPRTAVSVARECKLINSTAFVFYPIFVEGDATTPRARLQWNGVDDESLRLDPYSLRPLPPPPHIVEDEERIYRDYALVLPGDVFRWMVNHAPLETLQQASLVLHHGGCTESAHRCSSKRKFLLACLPTRSTNWSSVCNPLGSPSRSVETVPTTVEHSKLQMSGFRSQRQKRVLRHRLRVAHQTLAVCSRSLKKDELHLLRAFRASSICKSGPVAAYSSSLFISVGPCIR